MSVRKNRHRVNFLNVIILLFCHTIPLVCQNQEENLIEYTPDFEFQEGIFLNFEMVKNNTPVPKASILSSVGYDDRDFFDKVTEEKEIIFFNHVGVKQKVKTSQIWGYSKNGTLYINLNGYFNRINVVGKISFFVANITTYAPTYDPYYYNPYGYSRYGAYPSNQKSTELKQYLLDWDSGMLYEFDLKSTEILLMKDPELHDEFMQLKKRKKRQLKFYYLRKFNERNKLLIPKNELL